MDMLDNDATDELAALLHATPNELVENIGGHWHRVSLPADDSEPDRQWFVSGDPLQVMIGVGDTDVRVAKPLFHWELPDRTFLEPEEILAVHDRYTTQGGALLRDAIEESERRRRASFRYCRYCRRLVAPEYLFVAATCQGCASRYHGVLY